MSKQFILRENEEPGIYPGLGVAEVGKPLTAYGEEQEKAFTDDKRFKVYHAPPPEPEAVSEPDSSTDEKPAKSGKGGK